MTEPGRAEEVGAKLASIRSWLEVAGHDGVLLTTQANFAWVTAGGRSYISIGEAGGVAFVLITRRAAWIITTNIELQRIFEEETSGLPFEGESYPWHEPDGASSAIAELCDPNAVVSDAPGGGFAVAGAGLRELRYDLMPSEITRYEALGSDAAEAVEAACRSCEPGDTEFDVAARVAHECASRDVLALVNLVASDDRIGRYRHPLPTARRIERTLLVALTGRRHGLHASLTRMVSFGAPDEDLAARHHAVARVDAREIAASKPGATLAAVMLEGADQYAQVGFPEEWRRHHQGGLTGYAGREIFATPRTAHRLRQGHALAWNPSITRVKSEDTIVVGADGHRTLTRTGRWPEWDAVVGEVTVARPSLLVR